jgi:DNA replication and repair protein RecF
VRVVRVSLRDFRNYERAEAELGDGLTVVSGPNGAGKTNLLEAIYFGCTARSPRTSNERELVRRGASVARVALEIAAADGGHTLEVGFEPGESKRVCIDDRAVESLASEADRPLVSVFMPERLELVKGAPAARRAHLDRFVGALWPARAVTRQAYSRALGQRNALLGRIRAGVASADSLDAWDAELSRHGAALMADREEAVAGLAEPFAELAGRLGLPAAAELRYRPRSAALAGEEAGPVSRQPAAAAAGRAAILARELAERRAADVERGFTAHGPHRDDVQLLLGGLSLRAYGSQGQQRVALLALLFAERDLLSRRRARPPLMLLDDVMSELDAERRELLAELLGSGGQAVVTTADAEHVPAARGEGARLLEVASGRLAPAAVAA